MIPNIVTRTPWDAARARDRDDILACLRLATRAQPLASGYAVGAVLYASDGRRFEGVNFEDGTGSPICAERVALGSAFAAGAREVVRVVVAGLFGQAPVERSRECPPCGHCREALLPYVGDAAACEIVYFDPSAREVLCTTLAALTPATFPSLPFDAEAWGRDVRNTVGALLTALGSPR